MRGKCASFLVIGALNSVAVHGSAGRAHQTEMDAHNRAIEQCLRHQLIANDFVPTAGRGKYASLGGRGASGMDLYLQSDAGDNVTIHPGTDFAIRGGTSKKLKELRDSLMRCKLRSATITFDRQI